MTDQRRVHEAITELTVGVYRVRVWTDTGDEMRPGPDFKVTNVLGQLWDTRLNYIAEALDAIPEVAAYEIKDIRGNGVVIYPRWP